MADPADAGSRNGSRPTIREVARRAGVSVATVSRAVTGAGPVGPATRLRVEQAIAATGWVPDPVARQLARAGGDHVMLVIGVRDPREFTDDPHYARVIAGAQQETADRGLSLAVRLAQKRSAASLPSWREARRCLGAVLVALVGFDDSAPALMTTPLLSTVRIPSRNWPRWRSARCSTRPALTPRTRGCRRGSLSGLVRLPETGRRSALDGRDRDQRGGGQALASRAP